MLKIKGTVSNHHQIGGEKSIKADDKKPPRLTFRCRSDENIFFLLGVQLMVKNGLFWSKNA